MTTRRLISGLLAMLPVLAAAQSLAEDVRYYEKDGVTYRESRRVVQRPVSETRYEDRERTVYRRELVTEHQPSYRMVRTPVTEYQLESYWIGRWNPLVQPTLAYRYVPRTHWETRSEVVEVPVTHGEWVAETRTTQVPVTTRRLVDEEVITRVAVSGSSGEGRRYARSGATPSLARREPVGGIGRLDNELPRQGTSTWRAADDTLRR